MVKSREDVKTRQKHKLRGTVTFRKKLSLISPLGATARLKRPRVAPLITVKSLLSHRKKPKRGKLPQITAKYAITNYPEYPLLPPVLHRVFGVYSTVL